MSLTLFLAGAPPVARPNPRRAAGPSIEATLGLGEPIEWRSEPAFASAVEDAEEGLDAALREADPRIEPRGRAFGEQEPVRWPFHVDAEGGVVTVEWWGDPEAPVRVPLVHGDEAQELVAAYGTAPTTGFARRAVRQMNLGGWWTAKFAMPLLDGWARFGGDPVALASAALTAARTVLPSLPTAARGKARLGLRHAAAFLVAPRLMGDTGEGTRRAFALRAAEVRDLVIDAGYDVVSTERRASNAVISALRGVAPAREGLRGLSELRTEVDLAFRFAAESGVAPPRAYARLARRLLPFGRVAQGAEEALREGEAIGE